jgi:uncharacterized protein
MATNMLLSRQQRSWLAWHDAFELAARAMVFEARMPVATFERLVGMLESSDGEIDVRLAFARGDEGIVRVSGSCRGDLQLVCQRCLGHYKQPMDTAFELMLLDDEALLEHVDDAHDREVATDRIRPLDFIEDELIMTLPLVPIHPDPTDCEESARRLLASATDNLME